MSHHRTHQAIVEAEKNEMNQLLQTAVATVTKMSRLATEKKGNLIPVNIQEIQTLLKQSVRMRELFKKIHLNHYRQIAAGYGERAALTENIFSFMVGFQRLMKEYEKELTLLASTLSSSANSDIKPLLVAINNERDMLKAAAADRDLIEKMAMQLKDMVALAKGDAHDKLSANIQNDAWWEKLVAQTVSKSSSHREAVNTSTADHSPVPPAVASSATSTSHVKEKDLTTLTNTTQNQSIIKDKKDKDLTSLLKTFSSSTKDANPNPNLEKTLTSPKKR